MKYNKLNISLTVLALFFLISACGDKTEPESTGENKSEEVSANSGAESIGVGPITSLDLPAEINQELATVGQEIFTAKCSACHKTDKRYIGPNPTGILERRTPEWVMNMILNPDGMVKEDEEAKKLLMEYNGTPMANQNLTEEEARAVLEYFRTL
ncbi:MAG: cytochrome c [Balneolaceae bacterium]|nr:cytochrome c [Balneolaceae bacterium]MBO6547084.1 cytochrome c [Balneolaceae bacterium]MBO6647969.1 cytochrome c [Balneolaceae bacterium]